MKIKFQKRVKKTFAVLAAVMLAVCSMAFSVSADEVIFNGTLTSADEGFEFPSYIPLTVGDTYSLTYNGVTDTGQCIGPVDDVPVPFVQFLNLGMVLISGDVGNGNQTAILLQSGNIPGSIDIILSKASGPDQSQDQVVFNQSLPFENLVGSYSVIAESSLQFIVGREYLVEVNGIERQYTAELKEIGGDTGIVLGPVPNVEGEISVTTTDWQGTPAIIINADNLLSGEGTYPVKITLLGIKPPSFLGSVTNAIGSVLSWVGIPINEMLNDGGALVALLPLFAIGISIAAIFVGIKLIRSFTWGN